jgi:FkbM family methyltransferase
MRQTVSRLRSLLQYMTVMRTPVDAYRYARLRMRYRSGNSFATPSAIRVRLLGGAPLLCRASQDVWTFKSTFLDRFHLPPRPLPENATILDLGSNVGYTVAHLAFLHPSARVVGVELDPRNYELAVQNTARFGPRVQLIHAAVWTKDGEITYTGDQDDAFRVTADADPVHARTAPAKRISTILDDCGIERVDYLKMDIEGAEAAILAGPLDWCDRVGSMKIEVHPREPRSPAARSSNRADSRAGETRATRTACAP